MSWIKNNENLFKNKEFNFITLKESHFKLGFRNEWNLMLKNINKSEGINAYGRNK